MGKTSKKELIITESAEGKSEKKSKKKERWIPLSKLVLEPKYPIQVNNAPQNVVHTLPTKPMSWRRNNTTNSSASHVNHTTNRCTFGVPELIIICARSVARNIVHFIECYSDQLNLIPQSFRDVMFSEAMDLGSIPRSHWKFFLHSALEQLNLSQYAQMMTDDRIEKLLLPKIHSTDSWEEIQQHSIFDLYSGFPNLRSLNLSCCTKLAAATVERIIAECPNLLHLDFSRNAHFKSIKISSPKLQSLNLSFTNCTFILKTPSLKIFKYGYCKNHTSMGSLLDLFNLEYLDISNWWNMDIVLATIKQNFSLSHISIRDSMITDNILQLFSKQLSSSVTSLDLTGNPIDIKAIISLIQTCPHLRNLVVKKVVVPEHQFEEIMKAGMINNPELIITLQ